VGAASKEGARLTVEAVYFWNIVCLLAVGTYAVRGSIIAISSRVHISQQIREILSFIPAAILPAFIVPTVFLHRGEVAWLLGKERFWVLLLATCVCFFSRSTLATIAFGLVALFLVTFSG
jgi:branched-subunit amino acid transport protein